MNQPITCLQGGAGMGICSDRSVRFLKSLGYNVVRLPFADIAPGQLIGRRGDDRRLISASIDGMFVENAGVKPKVKTGVQAAGISGQSTSKIPIELGIDILGSVLGSFGAKASLAAKYEHAKSVKFTYENVLRDSLDLLELGSYIIAGKVAWSNPVLARYLTQDGKLYVIDSVIKSRKFTVEAQTSNGASLGLTLPEIQPLISEASLDVGVDTSRANTVTYEGTTPLVFGFTCVELAALDDGHDGEFRLSYRPVEAGGAFLSVGSSGAAGVPPPTVLTDDGLLREIGTDDGR